MNNLIVKKDTPLDVLFWVQKDAIYLCKEIERISPKFGAHVALTGGTLYKLGRRKDVDIVFYRIRQVEKIEVDKLFEELNNSLNIEIVSGFGWCYKARFMGKSIDFFFPEENGTYENGDE